MVEHTKSNEAFTEALCCAARGWPVFPLIAGRKEPLTPNGFKAAACDPDSISQWWTRWPDANVGIATGLSRGWLCSTSTPRAAARNHSMTSKC